MTTENPKYCYECGKKISRKEAEFCPFCGTKQESKKEFMGSPSAPIQISTNRRGAKVFLAIVIIVLFVIGLGIANNRNVTGNIVAAPQFILVSQNANNGFVGLDYVEFVNCFVRNTGNAPGNVVVTAELYGGEYGYEKQDQNIYLSPGETRETKFTMQVSFWRGQSPTYRCSVR